MALVPEIKLIRTDTTLDLSQKAEKVCFDQRTSCIYSAWCLLCDEVTFKWYVTGFCVSHSSYGQTTMDIPDPIRTPKSSMVGLT